MKYETIEDLKRAEAEVQEVDRLLEQEQDSTIKDAVQATAVALGAGGVGIAGGGVALFFAGITGFSGAGIVSGLVAIGGTMLGGLAVLALAPVIVAGGGFWWASTRQKRAFAKARSELRTHAIARRDFLRKLVSDNDDKAEKLTEYRFHLDRLTRLVEALG
ncbi:MAG: hypothetical protein Q8M65_05990 [Rhodoglobus sp.]|nr:hypothetical protein [Rhodoglobus sp.]